MADLNATLRVVVEFLATQGCDRQNAISDLKNGRWIYDTCKQIIAGGVCPNCVDEVLKHTFRHLEDGSFVDGTPLQLGESPWTRAFTNAALKAGGFPEWKTETA